MINTVLVICVGNICRSPIGEALFTEKLRKHVSTVHVSSAGLGALVGWPADSIAQTLMIERGLDISYHRARQISPQLLFDSDIIFTMTSKQLEEIEGSLPSIRGRVHRLGHWGGYDVPDPFQRPREAFEQALVLIEQGVRDWYEKLWK